MLSTDLYVEYRLTAVSSPNTGAICDSELMSIIFENAMPTPIPIKEVEVKIETDLPAMSAMLLVFANRMFI